MADEMAVLENKTKQVTYSAFYNFIFFQPWAHFLPFLLSVCIFLKKNPKTLDIFLNIFSSGMSMLASRFS